MGKAIQCPTCGRKHRVGALPDAPSFPCEGCGQRLKVPAQFRPSVMASARHVERPAPAASRESTTILRSNPAPTAAAAAGAPPEAARTAARSSVRPRPSAGAAGAGAAGAAVAAGPRPIALPLRLLAWVVALALALVVIVWVARVSGWLSGDRLVDVFTGTGGITRYLRVLALAPVWALVTTLFLTGILEGGRALARRREAVRANRDGSGGGTERAARRPVEKQTDDAARDGAGGDGHGSRRAANRRGAP